MNVFISHSMSDDVLITSIKKGLEPYGLKLFIAEHVIEMELSVTEKIENMIRNSDVALILLTQNGFNSKFVQQEIGYIKSQKLPFLLIIQSGIEKEITGFIYGSEYVILNSSSYEETIEKVKSTLLNHLAKKNQEKRKAQIQELESLVQMKQQEMERIRNNEEVNEKLIIIGLSALVIIGLLSSIQNK